MASDSDRVREGRHHRYKNVIRARNPEFISPYPWMSDAEAMMHLELERRLVRFSWRFFSGKSPFLEQLLPDYAPEFTIPDQKLVLTITGEYFGTLPGVIDREALAQVALEEDGWKMVSMLGEDIKRKGPGVMLDEKVPELRGAGSRAGVMPSPYDPPTYFNELRKRVSALALKRSTFALDDEQRPKRENRHGTTRTRPRRERRRPRNARRQSRREGSD